MKRRTSVIALLGLCAVAWAQPGKQVIARARITAERPNKWAIIVGVNAYDDEAIRDLTCSVADARAMYDVLVDPDCGGFSPDSVLLLTDGDVSPPTFSNIHRALGMVGQMAGPEDVVLFYFSGHGIEEGGEGYLLPSDAQLPSVRWTAVPLAAVRNVRERSGCRVQICIVDACRSDLTADHKGTDGLSEAMQAALFADAEGIAVMSSASAGQASYEDSDTGRSVYTQFLVEALGGAADAELAGNGDGLVSVYEAVEYARARVRSWALQHGRTQNPSLQLEAAGEIVLTLAEIGPPPPAPVPPVVSRAVTTAVLRVEGAEGRTVYIEGEERGTAPCEITIDLGHLEEKTVDCFVWQEGDVSATAYITLRRGSVVAWRPPPELDACMMLVGSEPPGVDIYRRGPDDAEEVHRGQTPHRFTVPAGETVLIVAVREGYRREETEMTPGHGQMGVLHFDLERLE